MDKISDVLLSPNKASRHPFEIFIVSFFYATLSIFIGMWLLPDYASLVSIFFMVLSCLYVIQSALIKDEDKESDFISEKETIKQHLKTLGLFMIIFLGFLFAFVFWTIVLPNDIASQAFKIQFEEYEKVRTITGNATSFNDFEIILTNNFRVLILSLIFSLFYGAGAIFIIAWNASILGFVMGSIAKETLGLTALPHITLKYFLHGIPEIFAYMLVALAGGILFITIIRGDVKKGKMKRILLDTFIIITLAIIILIISALIETYISPRI